MRHTKESNEIMENAFVDPEIMIECKHCGKPINQTKLIGLSLICPLCGKPQNGLPHVKNIMAPATELLKRADI